MPEEKKYAHYAGSVDLFSLHSGVWNFRHR
jgi:hypothetical protein